MNPLGVVNAPVDCTVSYFIDGSAISWDRDKVVSAFSSQVAKEILKIPISNRLPPDKLFWPSNKNGLYTVKSGYYKACSILNRGSASSSSSSDHSDLWKTIWRVLVQPKIRHFLWRICHGTVPCKNNLVRPSFICVEGLRGSPRFVVVIASESSVDHGPTLLLVDWIRSMFESLKSDELQAFIVSLWVLWNDRNNIVFDNPRLPAQFLFSSVPAPCDRVAYQPVQSRANAPAVWIPPPSSWIKVNTEAVVVIHKDISVISAVCRVQDGSMMKSGVSILHGLAATTQVHDAILESDALSVIRRLQQESTAIDNIQLIADDCITMAKRSNVVF
ncbi:uncharacterized protein LOC126687613 [Mercurialis annua]|uniref:uncharacterized protein LOC126687613 n=1 Tax=Mercurialis annua TaxID=3986 RepID=UPI00215F6F4A|nr:uncharacterized protein LOC126687613 [Mercurialis annua]